MMRETAVLLLTCSTVLARYEKQGEIQNYLLCMAAETLACQEYQQSELSNPCARLFYLSSIAKGMTANLKQEKFAVGKGTETARDQNSMQAVIRSKQQSKAKMLVSAISIAVRVGSSN